MALSKIEFVKGSGGLARRSASDDGISGLLFYQDVPTAFSSEAVQLIYSLTEAEQLGITTTDEPVAHYHIEEFFRANKGGVLYVGFYEAPVAVGEDDPEHDFTEVESMQTYAEGEIRQLGIYTQLPFVVGMVSDLQTVIAALEAEDMPVNAILCADVSAIALNSLPNLRSLQAANVSVIIGQDGDSTGADLFDSEGATISALGSAIGVLSKASVHESIAWVGKFNVGGTELDVPALGNGTLTKSITRTQLDAIDTKGYIFLQKHRGIGGTYFNSSWTCSTGDYDTIEKCRAIDKAVRLVRSSMLPSLSAPLYVKPTTGTLSEDTVQAFSNEAYRPIGRMADIGELSGAGVFINPAQNVLENDELEITIELVPVGVSRKIRINIGFKAKLSTAA